jgi:hypothetical protein
MVDFRLYRAAFVPALLALVALMFSLQGLPGPLEPAVPTGSFEAGRAMAVAREIVAGSPDRQPGSEGDMKAADLVAERFAQIESGTSSEQQFEASFDGDDVTLRNVLLTLPGESDSTIVVIAARDSAHEPAAASSAAATGVLVELGEALAVAGHEKTYVLASTSGVSEGATGAQELIDGLPETQHVEAVVVVSQPGATDPRRPFVVTTSTGTRSTSIQLSRSADNAVQTQVDESSGGVGVFGQVARLAIPSGIGEQAPLIEMGLDAVAISSAGEGPLEPSEDAESDLSGATVGQFGRAAQSVVQAVDAAGEPLEHGPGTYVEVGGNLVPGWTLALLALALLLPALVAAVDAAARAMRRSADLGAGIGWAASLALPAIGALALLYALSFVGLVPRPSYPFDPGRFSIGAAAGVSIVLLAATVVATVVLLRARRPTAASRESGIAALGVVSSLAVLIVWLANPYLGLLLAPAAHVWLIAAGSGGRARVAVTALAAALSLLPAIAAVGDVVGALELGADAPWTLMIMVANGQIGITVVLALCFVLGALVGAAIVSRDRWEGTSREV